jgi:small subunit ribosomal protein S8
MAITDPISDMLARIRNAHQAYHKQVFIPASRVKQDLASILKEQGYVEDVGEANGDIEITLRYEKGKALISGMKRVSTPGRRVYVKAQDIPRVQNGLGVCVLTTSHGVMDGESARQKNVGGEVICEIW